jgi:phosphatidylglycerophosphate synthase
MLRFVADGLSLALRGGVATVGVTLATWHHVWWAALAFLIVGWVSDLYDGPLARRYGSLRDQRPAFDADGIGDTLLAFSSTGSIVVYYWRQSEAIASWLLIGLLITVVSAIIMVVEMGRKHPSRGRRAVVAVNMIIMHGAVQIVATIWWYVWMATGDVTIAVCVAAYVVVVTTAINWAKVQLWRSGKLQESDPTPTPS